MTDIKKLSNETLAQQLVEMKKIMEELEAQFAEAKTELESRNLSDTIYVPEFESKVYVAEGRTSTDYDVMKVYSEMVTFGIMQEFPKIVKINKSQIDKIELKENQNLVNSILLKNAILTEGKPSITVRKMTKQEIKEHTL